MSYTLYSGARDDEKAPETSNSEDFKSNHVETMTESFAATGTIQKDPLLNITESNTTESGSLDIEQKSTRGSILGTFWLWEILACAFSFISIVALIGLLKHEDQRPLNEWTVRITPNAIVSFIAALTKSSFLVVVTEILGQLKWLHFHKSPRNLSDLSLFDQASRGPWGSIKLLLLKNGKTVTASCAAVVVLLALLVDPFVQLVITFPSKNIITPGLEAKLTRTIIHDPNGLHMDRQSTNFRGKSHLHYQQQLLL